MADLRQRLHSALTGRYQVVREVGRGGMAIVYLARDLRHDRDVALKVLRPELAATLGPERFLQEIRVAAGLAHPHILPLHDSGDADGCLYYVMPFVAGESLRDRLIREGPLPLEEALQIAREVADALAYAHGVGIVHRDIKPENILLFAGHATVSDFGIARAISAAGSRRMTSQGVAVGTPDYMSPEQATAGDEIDGRSDIYSLGCVVFETLTGQPPAWPTPAEGTGAGPARARDRRTELAALRPTIPVETGDAIARALALDPADRFQTAAEFAAALTVPTGLYTPRSVLARRRRRIGLGLAGAALFGALAVALLPKVFGAGLDRSLYVVLPFGHRNGAAPALLDGDQCESALYDAFSRWSDVRVVGEPQAHDAWLRRRENARTFTAALDVARTVRAGMLVWGEVWGLGDSVFVRAGLYDVRAGGAALITRTVHIARGDTNVGATFNALADSLLLGRAHTALAVAGAGGTNVFAAWLAYDAGHAARNQWDLDAARTSFRRAIELDPGYPHANLWLAQVMDWQGAPAAEWRGYAAMANSAATELSPPQRQSAAALLDLADGRYVEACERYQRLVARDSLDFTAWFGLGDCHRLDRLVVRDAASPSTWRFRGSYATAIAAYRRALEVIPSSHRAFGGTAYQRLARLFAAEPNWLRGGYALGPDTLWMAAAPGLDHDTLTFVPYPMVDVLEARPGTYPATTVDELTYSREMLRRVALSWVAAFPGSAAAHETLARVLESRGEVREDLPESQSALTAVRRARAVSRQAEEQLRLAVAETRLLVKVGQFVRARQLADSVLDAHREAGPVVAWQLAPLAALTGRVYLASHLLQAAAALDSVMRESGQLLVPPLPVREAALGLLAYAAFGTPADSVLVIRGRVEQLAKSWAPATRLEALRRAALDEPAALAFFETGLWSVHRPLAQAGPDYVLGMQFALAHGDRAAIRAEFRRLAVIRNDIRPGDVAIDATYLEARTLLALGDTTAATHLLDLSLDALPGLGTELLDGVPEPATLVRAMALRAGLAARARDVNTRRRWAGAVGSLWLNADPALRPAVDSMQRMSGPS